MAALLRSSDTLIIEDDSIGDVSRYPAASLGRHCPERTVHIVSY